MQINVKLYQPFRFADGCSVCRLVVPAGHTISDLLVILDRMGVFVEFGREGAFVVANNDVAIETYVLSENETVKVLPRLAGG